LRIGPSVSEWSKAGSEVSPIGLIRLGGKTTRIASAKYDGLSGVRKVGGGDGGFVYYGETPLISGRPIILMPSCDYSTHGPFLHHLYSLLLHIGTRVAAAVDHPAPDHNFQVIRSFCSKNFASQKTLFE
jgi:hypothetical protein